MRTYLDHNATSPLRPESSSAMRDVLDGPAGNPSSVHSEGRAARAHLEAARAEVASLIGAAAREIVFTSGGSEAVAAAIFGACLEAPPERRRIVVTAVEHSSVLESARAAERLGQRVEIVPCDRDGLVDAEAFGSRVGPDVSIAAMQWANNETGVVQPVDAVHAACALSGTPLLVDAVQGAGKLEPWAESTVPDLVAISAHKIGGPPGAGALIVRDGVTLAPLVPGGAQERRRRGGTEAVASIVGFGAAARVARVGLADERARLGLLRDALETALRGRFPEIRIHGSGAPRLPNTSNFAIPGVPGEILVIALDVAGFALSTGSACASGATLPSHVIRAMGFDEREARGAVRVSLGWSTTQDDVARFLDAVPRIVGRVRDGLSGS